MIALDACICSYMWPLPKTSLLYAGGGTQASPASKVFVTFNRLADLAVDNKLFTLSSSKASFAPCILNSFYSAAIAPSCCFFCVVYVAAMLYAGVGTQASPASKVFVTFNRLADLAVDNKLFTLSSSKASFAPFILNSFYSAAIAPSCCFFLRRVCSSYSFLKRSSSLPPSHVCISRVLHP